MENFPSSVKFLQGSIGRRVVEVGRVRKTTEKVRVDQLCHQSYISSLVQEPGGKEVPQSVPMAKSLRSQSSRGTSFLCDESHFDNCSGVSITP
jgi:hypothetical protein